MIERVFLSCQDKMKIYQRPATVCGVSQNEVDVSVNILTYSALKNNKITVFGGTQVLNIHIDDICGVYLFLLNNQESIPSGTFNAGFENISLLDIAPLKSNYQIQKLKLPHQTIPDRTDNAQKN